MTPHEQQTRALGRYIASIRKQAGRTQAQLADALGVTRGFVSAVELGHAPLPNGLWSAAKDALPCLMRGQLVALTAQRAKAIVAQAERRRAVARGS